MSRQGSPTPVAVHSGDPAPEKSMRRSGWIEPAVANDHRCRPLVGGRTPHARNHWSVFRVYNTLGFGFLEHVYAAALEPELMRRGLSVSREYCVRIYYDGAELCQQRLDLVVDDKVVVEIKSTVELHKSAARQVRRTSRIRPDLPHRRSGIGLIRIHSLDQRKSLS
jgi:GxxExxY protein